MRIMPLRIRNFLLDLLFPISCQGCGMAGAYLCTTCAAALPDSGPPVCPGCSRLSPGGETCSACRNILPLDGLIAGSSYEVPAVRRLVLACKYRFVRDIAGDLGRLMLRELARTRPAVFSSADIVLVPIPLHAARERERGFNQSGDAARVVAAALNLPCYAEALVRVRRTGAQAKTESRRERRENIKGAFAVKDAALLAGKTVILVDDVATTLATLAEAARALKAAGAREVWGLVAAREHLGSRS